jgi:hypothetical protein
MFPKIESLEGSTFIQRATAEQCEKLLRGVSLTLDGHGKIAVQQRGALPRGSELRQHYAHYGTIVVAPSRSFVCR